MKERPILFNAAMVRAILDGKKTQTRRVIKPQPKTVQDGVAYKDEGLWGGMDMVSKINCPYGIPGDRLWVREKWACVKGELHNVSSDTASLYFYADRTRKTVPANRYAQECDGKSIRWRPSIHMPRIFSRILLEITDIRVERVQDISRADAYAEGLTPGANGLEQACGRSWGNAQLAFQALWDSINGKKHPWDSNSWVWVVSFRRIEL